MRTEVVAEAVVRPPWPCEPPRSAGPGGLVQIRGTVVWRAVACGGEVALAQAAWRGDEVLVRAGSHTPQAAEHALERMRFVLALDDDVTPFHREFRPDPLLGRFLRARPGLRVLRKPSPFEALAWAIVEQVITTKEAGDIAWALTRALGRRHPAGPWCAPEPDALDNPAALQAAGLHPARARLLARVARAVARGEIDPATDRARLAAIPGVGEWTLAHLDLLGRGVYDVPLARDAGMRNCYARLAGVRTGSVTEEEFAAVLERYKPWQGLAAAYLVAAGWRGGGRWSNAGHDLRRRR